MAKAFDLLDPRIQRFIWQEKWTSLRPIQEMAIPVAVQGNKDVIIAASTAAGKTEAAFFPALTYLAQNPGLIVYISPLKALINDQYGRLELLCNELRLPVYPWHGDLPAAGKARFMKQPSGVLLITPESLEAMLCRKGTQIGRVFGGTAFFIIDELHAFIGAERGKQLQALMHRIDAVVGKNIPRLGLSATLGDMRMAADFLRPGHADDVEIINVKTTGAQLKILVKGYEEPKPAIVSMASNTADDDSFGDDGGEPDAYQQHRAQQEKAQQENDEAQTIPWAQRQVAKHMFSTLRGSNNLVFPNSRANVELYTHLLNAMSAELKLPAEFWPHHGSLSKEVRADTEAALKQKTYPATAICTNTLELGIDIGSVKSVVQIGPPPTVASVRQRLGRSGRRGEPAILRGYCIEPEVADHEHSLDALRLNTVKMAAMVTLLTESWFEPPPAQGMHLSTLVQQILSVTAQKNGIRIGPLYQLLCGASSPFAGLNKADFANLVRHLGSLDLLMQDSSGTLIHGKLGESFVNDYQFYAAFASEEEYRLQTGGRTLGTIPLEQIPKTGQRIVFAGRTWSVDSVHDTEKVVVLSKAPAGAPPVFVALAGQVHSVVTQRMRDLLQSNHDLPFLDATAQRFLTEGRVAYQAFDLSNNLFVKTSEGLTMFTWLGDASNAALAYMLAPHGIQADHSANLLKIKKGPYDEHDIVQALHTCATVRMPSLDEMLVETGPLKREKWDWALPDDLLRRAYASMHLNLQEAQDWAARLQP